MLSQPMWIHAYSSGNALVAPQIIPASMQINHHDLLAGV
jgi:hypothetical protein